MQRTQVPGAESRRASRPVFFDFFIFLSFFKGKKTLDLDREKQPRTGAKTRKDFPIAPVSSAFTALIASPGSPPDDDEEEPDPPPPPPPVREPASDSTSSMRTKTSALSSFASAATRSKSLATALPDSENHLENRAGAETSSSRAPPGKRDAGFPGPQQRRIARQKRL